MAISIIIPTLDRARLLNRTLLSLANQITDEDHEIIVVDNGSKDNTREICKLHEASFKNLVYVYDDRPGLLVGRHIGAQRARGEILTFIDDDVIIPPYWLQGITEVFDKSGDVSLATGNNYPFFENPPPEWLNQMWCKYGSAGQHLYQLSFLCFGSRSMVIDPGYVWGLNFHIRKDTFFDLGGFNPDILPSKFRYFIGDGELGITRKVKARNIKAFFDPRLSLYHTATRERLTKEYFLHRSYTEGLMNGYTDIRKIITSGTSPRFSPKNEQIKKLKQYIKYFSILATNNSLFTFKRDMITSSVRGYNDYLQHVAENSLVMEYIREENYLNIDSMQSKYYSKIN